MEGAAGSPPPARPGASSGAGSAGLRAGGREAGVGGAGGPHLPPQPLPHHRPSRQHHLRRGWRRPRGTHGATATPALNHFARAGHPRATPCSARAGVSEGRNGKRVCARRSEGNLLTAQARVTPSLPLCLPLSPGGGEKWRAGACVLRAQLGFIAMGVWRLPLPSPRGIASA